MLCDKCSNIEFCRFDDLSAIDCRHVMKTTLIRFAQDNYRTKSSDFPFLWGLVCDDRDGYHVYQVFEPDLLYHVLHDNGSALEQSKTQCDLCLKLWIVFTREGADTELKFQKSLPIVLSIWMNDDSAREPDADEIFESQALVAQNGGMRITSAFDMHVPDGTILEMSDGNTQSTDDNVLSSSNMALANAWLKNCREHHNPCRALFTEKCLPYRIINLSDPNAPFLGRGDRRKAPYVALSYTWGSGRRYTTTLAKIDQMQRLITLQEMPKTFQDAIFVASAIGFSYLWIDAICIPQDSKEELREQIQLMGDIYSGASVTIFATAGNGLDAGLGFKRNVRERKPTRVPIRAQVDYWSFQKSLYVVPFHYLSKEPARVAPMSDRGWVLQEELLAARALLFHTDQMSWRYLCDTASEAKPGCQARRIIDDFLYSYILNDAQFSENPFKRLRILLRDHHALPHPRGWRAPETRFSVFDEWYMLVQFYLKRNFTYPTDVIPAISGIASILSESHGYSFVAGLWLEDIQCGLLWKVTDVLKDKYDRQNSASPNSVNKSPRKLTKWTTVEQFDGCPTKARLDVPETEIRLSMVDIDCPSWSWISHLGSGYNVEFEHWDQYIRHESLGLQSIGTRFIQLDKPCLDELGVNRHSIALKVGAHSREAMVSGKTYRGRTHNLIDSDFGKNFIVAHLWPDYEDAVVSSGIVRCVICAVADRPSWKNSHKAVYTGIGVVPIPGHVNLFRRVGYIEITNNNWVGLDASYNLERGKWKTVRKLRRFQRSEFEIV